MDNPVKSPKRIPWASWLSIPLLFLIVIRIAPELNRLRPFEPKIYLTLEPGGTCYETKFKSDCGDVGIPNIGSGQTVEFHFDPKPGCAYILNDSIILGEHLNYLIVLGREQRSHVEITIGYNSVYAGLANQSGW